MPLILSIINMSFEKLNKKLELLKLKEKLARLEKLSVKTLLKLSLESPYYLMLQIYNVLQY